MTTFARIRTPLGPMVAIADGAALSGLDFEDAKYAPAIDPAWAEDPSLPVLRQCARQLAEYFAGRRTGFDLPLAPSGTHYQQRVWREIAKIRHGETITYAELAHRAGTPGAARAAGSATGRNPLAIVVPCHRVIGSKGALTGYAGGLPRKERLLALESPSKALPI